MSSKPESIQSLLSDSESLLPSEHDAHQEHHLFQEVPLESTIADDAASRQISRIQSRRSLQSRVTEKPVEKDDSESVASISNDSRFDRFPRRKKELCVIIGAISCFLSPLSGLTFLPAIPEIAARFNTTGEMINVSSAVYCVFMSLSPCIFSPLSDIYGRKIIFVICSFFFSVFTILVAVSVNLPMFFVFRALTALFATAFFSVAAHMVGDLFIPTQRGEHMAWIISGAQLGSAFGSVLGGIIVNFTSWRVIFWVLAGIGFLVCILAIVFLPETSVKTKHQMVLDEVHIDNPKKKFVFVPFNPFRIIWTLKYINLVLDGFISMALIFTMYTLLTPIRYVMDPRFNLTSPIYSGLFYLAPGCGYLIGSFYGGKWADQVVKKWIKIRGRRVPEDRLRQVIIPLGFVYPVSILIYGWTMEKSKGGIAVPVVFMFISGVAQTCVFPASNTYCIDSMPELAGDAIGGSYFTRYIASAVASAGCLKSIENIGIGWTCTYSAIVLWVGLLCAIILIYFGEELRLRDLVRHGFRPKEELEEKRELRRAERVKVRGRLL